MKVAKTKDEMDIIKSKEKSTLTSAEKVEKEKEREACYKEYSNPEVLNKAFPDTHLWAHYEFKEAIDEKGKIMYEQFCC